MPSKEIKDEEKKALEKWIKTNEIRRDHPGQLGPKGKHQHGVSSSYKAGGSQNKG